LKKETQVEKESIDKVLNSKLLRRTPQANQKTKEIRNQMKRKINQNQIKFGN
jgi:hypothetical protein